MTSRRQPSGKGKERSEPQEDHEDDIDDEQDLEEKLRRPKDDRILCFIPNDGIDYNVIRTEIPSFLGPEASVQRGRHPKNERPGYYIRAYQTISISMISDLKMDTIRWSDEMRISNNKEYRLSNTHRLRQKSGPTPDPSVSPSAGATPSNRLERNEGSRSILFDPNSRITELQHQENPLARVDRGQQAHVQRVHDESTRPPGFHSLSEAQVQIAQSQDSRSSLHERPQPATAIFIQNIQQTRNNPVPAPSAGAQPTYTRQDVEKKVAQKLRDQGYSQITRAQLDKAVDNAMRSLKEESTAREERATSVPPPYSEHPGQPGKPPPSQPDTGGTRGFQSNYATAGPNYSRHAH